MIDEPLPSSIYLIDEYEPLICSWTNAFANYPEVKVVAGDYFQQPADAIVSPANSFGIMDGGLDLAIRDRLGYAIQGKVQEVIVDRFHGELPVGTAEVVATEHDQWKYLIVAPTMRVPGNVSQTFNAYLAFRAVLVAIERMNQAANERVIDSLVCCGLCTGVGAMTPDRAATQMELAYKSVIMPASIGRFESIHEFHRQLRNT